MNRSIAAALALAVGVGCSGALAQNVFRGVASTADGYATWDSDLINIEAVTQTGAGVYVAVLDTGLVPNWRDYFPEARVATELGAGFHQPVTFKAKNQDPCGLDVEVGHLTRTTWVGSRGSTHGTHVASTILGYFYRSNSDAAQGYPLPPIMVRGIAPDVTIVPIKVLSDYQVPALPKCGYPGANAVFGTSSMVAAGIRHATELKKMGYSPMVINMSLGGSALEPVEKAAIDYAIGEGVLIVASAGNSGERGMGYPGAYAPVISVAASGWVGEWQPTGNGAWWYNRNVPDPTNPADFYITDFSSRELPGQDLDVAAPGSWVVGPYQVNSGQTSYYFLGGTSMAAPHVAGIVALMAQKNPALVQSEAETILEGSAIYMAPGCRDVFEPSGVSVEMCWGEDATGAGLATADAALDYTP
jgi:subtilisin family serine protease